jgi:4-hydroxythreonine-4-phosphate dehydrogenase
MGDPAGIGGEIAVAAWRRRDGLGGALPPFFVIDDPERLGAIAVPDGVVAIGDPAEAAAAFGKGLPVLPLRLPAPSRPGVAEPANAHATVASVDRAVALAREGRVAGIVTAPVTKRLLQEGAGFAFPGHTEYLAHLGGVRRTVMMLVAPGLRVVPVTIHIPLVEVARQLTADAIIGTARIVQAALVRDFGIAHPRLAVSGLNPHAGEGGMLGREEIEVIAPALDLLRGEGMAIEGPMPADTMFHPAARARYDAALTMFHDQGLVAVKTLDFARGVNVTLGLPFIRTSPDHGTAYDIAGTGCADPSSLIEAIRLAGAMACARAAA